jgi:delta(3,5)-delta(2,4)-dienoyl-CoA isomerase
MTTYQTLRVEIKGLVASVILSNGKANAMSSQFFQECGACFRELGQNTNVRCIVLKADGKYFTVGLDLKDASNNTTNNNSTTTDVARKALKQRAHLLYLQDCFSALEHCPQPIILATHGATIGGGIDLCCCCDIRLASEQAFFSIKEVDVGLCADLGTLQRLPKIVGNTSKICEWAYTARRFDAQEALRHGLVSTVYPTRESLYAGADAMAQVIASKSPVAVYGTKINLQYARDHSVAQSLEYQATWSGSMLQSEDLPKSFVASLNKSKATYSKL